jgi:adenylyltransferase/sulfurtransferase
MLDEIESVRYGRQIKIPGFGREGQIKMKSARVVIAGVGGLGGYSSLSLTSAGVGHLTVIDDGLVELSNLNRQVLYQDGDLGKAKAEIAAERLSYVNPLIEIVSTRVKITGENARELISGAHVVVDGMDNFPGRLSLNAACFRAGVPFVYGGIYGLKGMVTTIIPGKTPCLACMTSVPHEVQEGVPVLGAIPALIGSIQALETIKLITGIGRPLAGKLLSFDGELGQWSSLGTLKRDSCPVCGLTPPWVSERK